MKKLFLLPALAIGLLPSLNLKAANKSVPTKVDKVTIFLQGAQIYHAEEVTIPTGTTEFVFNGVSPYLDPSTLFSSGRGNFLILDTRFNTRYPEEILATESNPLEVKYQNQIDLKNDSIADIGYELKILEAKKRNLVNEKNFLEGNRLIKGETKRDTLNLVKDALEYYRSRMGNIDQEWVKATREEDRLNKKKRGIEARLNDLVALVEKVRGGQPTDESKPSYEVIVTVSADAAQTGTIEFNYYTQQASWSAEYDLKATAASSAIQLVQKAKIYQNTGMDWKNVNITLSTGNPRLSNTRPYLNPVYLYGQMLATQEAVDISTTGRADDFNESLFSSRTKSIADLKKPVAGTAANVTQVTVNPILVEYAIDAKYSIPADNQQHTVVVGKKDLDTKFEYYSVPKLDKDAFLQARLTNWEELNLVAGAAKIYFDGSFIGNSSINPDIAVDTLNLDMGRDRSLVIDRKKIKEKTKEKFFDEKRELTRSYTITVRNTKNLPITLQLQDQMPLSNNKDIVVEAIELDGGKADEYSGIVSWDLKLKPKETKVIKFTYSVKAPKQIQLVNLP